MFCFFMYAFSFQYVNVLLTSRAFKELSIYNALEEFLCLSKIPLNFVTFCFSFYSELGKAVNGPTFGMGTLFSHEFLKSQQAYFTWYVMCPLALHYIILLDADFMPLGHNVLIPRQSFLAAKYPTKGWSLADLEKVALPYSDRQSST